MTDLKSLLAERLTKAMGRIWKGVKSIQHTYSKYAFSRTLFESGALGEVIESAPLLAYVDLLEKVIQRQDEALEVIENLADGDYMKSETLDGEEELWVNEADVKLNVEETQTEVRRMLTEEE